MGWGAVPLVGPAGTPNLGGQNRGPILAHFGVSVGTPKTTYFGSISGVARFERVCSKWGINAAWRFAHVPDVGPSADSLIYRGQNDPILGRFWTYFGPILDLFWTPYSGSMQSMGWPANGWIGQRGVRPRMGHGHPPCGYVPGEVEIGGLFWTPKRPILDPFWTCFGPPIQGPCSPWVGPQMAGLAKGASGPEWAMAIHHVGTCLETSK